MGEQAAWGRSAQAAFEGARFRLLLSGTPFRSDNTPIPWITYDDDGVSSADYAYGYTEALLDGVCRPVTFHTYDGDMEWMSRRPPPARGLLGRPARRRGRPPPAHRARPGGRLDRAGAARRRRAPDRPARRPAPRRRRARGGDRHGARRPARRPAGADLRRAAGDRDLRDRGRLGADRALRRRLGPLARLGADGLRGRRHPAAARRRLRDDRAHGAVLPPGRRALRAPHAGAARPDEPPLPRLRPAAQAARRPDRGGAQPRARSSRPRARRSPSSASAPRPSEAFRALWSSARRDDDVLQTTAPGEALQLFADAAPAPRRPRWPPSPPPRRRGRRASPRHDRREQLRDERRALVAAVSRRTGEAHRAIHGRINRETGAALGRPRRASSSSSAATACSSARRASGDSLRGMADDDGLDAALLEGAPRPRGEARAAALRRAASSTTMMKMLPVAESARRRVREVGRRHAAPERALRRHQRLRQGRGRRPDAARSTSST